MDERWTRLAALAVHGANVQPDQTVMVSAEIGQEDAARAIAAAAYDHGAKFVDVVYFDPYLKRARMENADPETLDYVPDWYGERLLTLADGHGARIILSGPTEPNLMNGIDPELLGKDRLPWLKEISKVIADRATNWTIVPCAHAKWARLVYPDLGEDESLERLWAELEHVLRLDEPDPVQAWEERMAVLNASAERLTARHFDAIELRGEGTELTVGMLPTHKWWAADFLRADGLRHLPNLPTEEVFTTPDPQRTSGHVTSTKPLVLRDGTIIRGLRVRFENGVAVEIEA